ncbi:hypothetical protein N7520_009148 [Penicillium odoratum]|uniref:uncharacterized protein n=1 Tax=Penicillium odoratum TaxID=1167516 RepID=UPI002548DE07|nr:uncharacterized protein N7520_009148 [Penicillium odoratum]KAJ5752231.1 hypothetical protein N7520_009148 [Penicillium odoratum]
MILSYSQALLLGKAVLSQPTAASSRCSPSFINKPDLLGATILEVQAQEVHNYSATSIAPGTNAGGRYTINFCNVTVTYTHPGWNDTINTQVWLPLEDWNGRFQAIGGGGYSTGFGSIYLTYAVAKGFASASTDGGLATGASVIPTDLSWALSSKNNVNWFLLKNYASKATNDMAVIGKQITKSFYQKAANYSYFTGCSGGGRQGLMMAQNFPDAFDGILAISPAINLETFIPAGYWPEQVMNQNHYHPPPCEVEAFTKAAVKACDRMDGVEDGIISEPVLCDFTAYDFVGQNFTCNGTRRSLSASGAKIVEAAWSGSGKEGWFGLNKDAEIRSYYIPTACSGNDTCYADSAPLMANWIQYLIAKDTDFEVSNMTEEAFFKLLHASRSQYASLVSNTESDLSSFKASGGKMITWHGLADEAIPPNGTIKYYEEVLEKDPKAHDFYRFFEAPGVAHCFGGLGPIPNGAISQLMDWVEKDYAPDTLQATGGKNNTARNLCLYPLQQKYVGGDPRKPASFICH